MSDGLIRRGGNLGGRVARLLAIVAYLLFCAAARAADPPQSSVPATDMAGQIVDENGQPVVDARVDAGFRAADQSMSLAHLASDAQGQFVLQHVATGTSLRLSVFMSGYAPEQRSILVLPDADPIAIVLTSGRTVSGQITDTAGNPVAGAVVSLRQLQGDGPSPIRAITDENGSYQLEHVPESTSDFVIDKPGYVEGSTFAFNDTAQANGKLAKATVIRGKVTDAKTGRPILQFTAMAGMMSQTNAPVDFLPNTQRTFTNGEYQMNMGDINSPGAGWAVRISADGYFTAVTRAVNESGTEDVALEPGKAFTGRVLTADGKPAVGATVTVARKGETVVVLDGVLSRGLVSAITGADGGFELPPQPVGVIVLAAGEGGIAEIGSDELKINGEMRLCVWGKIQGQVLEAGKPAAGHRVRANLETLPGQPSEEIRLVEISTVRTDEQGRYVMDRVVPGMIQVSHLVPNGTPVQTGQVVELAAQTREAMVTSGSVMTMNFGDAGRTVSGVVDIPVDLGARRDWTIRLSMASAAVIPQPAVPRTAMGAGPAGRDQWLQKFWQSEEGKAMAARIRDLMMSRGQYSSAVDDDGKFHMEGVLPGDYAISVMITQRTGRLLLSGRAVVSVPPIAGGLSEEPVDVPRIDLFALGNAPRVAGLLNNPLASVNGVVQDEQGKPIAGADVRVAWTMAPTDDGIAMETQTAPVQTDINGRWTSDRIPIDAISAARVLIHRDGYVDKVAPMTVGKNVVILSQGVDLGGQVVDTAGSPIAGAQVIGVGVNSRDSAITDAAGGFVLHHLEASATIGLTTVMKGYAPMFERRKAPPIAIGAAAPAVESVRITLTGGRTLSGHLIDESGQPVEGVKVALMTTEQTAALNFNVLTDNQGQFEMPDAPMDSVGFVFTRQGFVDRATYFAAGTDHQEITLFRSTLVHGKVIDAQTRQAVADFSMMIGHKPQPQSETEFGAPARFTDGQYQFRIKEHIDAAHQWYVRIDAKGYAPIISGPYADTGEVTRDFELEHGKDLEGIISRAGRAPAAGTDVAVIMAGQTMQIQNGRLASRGSISKTDASGHYDLPPQIGSYTLLAVGDGGYAMADDHVLANSHDLTLQAWGRLEGQTNFAATPAAPATVLLFPMTMRYPDPVLRWIYATTPDAAGKYRFDRVPAGIVEATLRIVEHVSNGSEVAAIAESIPATIVGGETETFDFGERPLRPVVGRVLFPQGLPDPANRKIDAWATSVDQLPDLAMSDAARQGTLADRHNWWEEYLQTPAGQTYAQILADHRTYYLDIDPDGKFQIHGASLGKYRISVRVLPLGGGPQIAAGAANFTMPPVPDGGSQDPLVVPDIPLVAQ